MSPYIHERLFAFKGEKVIYDVLDIPPDFLAGSIPMLKAYDGFSVTIPHKSALIPFLDSIDQRALRQGSVNTVVTDGFKGFSTDADGFLMALKSKNTDYKSVLCLGCGGASRAVGFEVLSKNASLTIAVRKQSIEKCDIMISDFRKYFPDANINIDDIENITGAYNLLFNGTPVGMYPNIGGMPVKSNVLDNVDCVFDAVYNPNETELVKQAILKGKKTVHGMDMLVWQAAASHKIWDGTEFCRKDIENIIKDSHKELERIYG